MKQWLITPQQLSGLEKGKVVIFDCRFSLADHTLGKQQFGDNHVPGAFHLDMELDLSAAIKSQHGGRHPLPDPSVFQQRMRQHGVNTDTLVVAYDNNRLAGAARLWWLLRYFGHSNVMILDGGLSGWQAAGFSTSTLVKPPKVTGNFKARPGQLPVVDRRWVSQHLNDPAVKLIDAREAIRYRGEAEPIDLCAGHIPGAFNAPWQRVTEENGTVKPALCQQQIWQQLPSAERYVVYCGSGVTACVNLLSMALAGVENSCLYDGGWSDWSSYPENPVAIGDSEEH
ncbi:MAG: sulfurtransferase [Porticoccaceae bacterium]|nr:sulfurtransferase [Pseudomonadales bacterium]MCP5171725.1 sulfurtransferase [Pseudomonadales bacterium]